MTHASYRRRLTGIAATTAVLAGLSLSGAGAAGAASTAPARAGADDSNRSIRYECTGPLSLVKVGVTMDVTNLPDGLPTGLELPSGIDVDVTMDFPVSLFSGLFGGLGGLGGFGGFGGLGQLDDLAMLFGGYELPLDEIVDEVSNPGSNPVLDAATSTGAVQLPSPGDYDLALPEEFSFSPLSFLGLSLFSIDCSMTSQDPVVDEVEVDEQEAEIETAPTTDDGTPVVLTRVTRELGGKGSGSVVATLDGTRLAKAPLRQGAAALRLRHLGAGKHAVTVTYLGNRTTKAASRVVKVRGAR